MASSSIVPLQQQGSLATTYLDSTLLWRSNFPDSQQAGPSGFSLNFEPSLQSQLSSGSNPDPRLRRLVSLVVVLPSGRKDVNPNLKRSERCLGEGIFLFTLSVRLYHKLRCHALVMGQIGQGFVIWPKMCRVLSPAYITTFTRLYMVVWNPSPI
ncbi:hypothetical protein FRX31_013457 [Thalictrum thalictroides]|uniref:Uncharacterized protein n=1 Tax=Thalictrum thalictroides TaxID=46969 RepID=A0A7J6WHP0_THATH|nr:hypothetical protein FRX31_013457 [Thalictrum thalictroides]